jgi:tetratricopeptide (TPR) repeat protein
MLFDARKQFSAPVAFRVVTTYEGGAAEAQREELAGDSLESVQEDYLRYYADSYPGIRVTAPMRVADDKARNRLTTTEDYAIADFAGKPDRDGKHTAWIETPDVDELLSDPEVKLRKAPLKLKYPLEVKATTEVLLPETWSITESDSRVDDPVFSFHRRVQGDAGQRRIVIHDEYRSLADEVAAREMPRYTANLAKARSELDYSLSWTDAMAPAAVAGAAGRGPWRSAQLAAVAAVRLCAVRVHAHGRPRLALRSGACACASNGFDAGRFARLAVAVFLQRGGDSPGPRLAAVARHRWPGQHRLVTLREFRRCRLPPAACACAVVPTAGIARAAGGLVAAAAALLCAPQQLPAPGGRFFVLWFACQAVDLLFAAASSGHSPPGEDLAQLAKFAIQASAWSAYLLSSRRVAATFVRRCARKRRRCPRRSSWPGSRRPRRGFRSSSPNRPDAPPRPCAGAMIARTNAELGTAMSSEANEKGWILHSLAQSRRYGPMDEDELRGYFRAGMVKSVDRLTAPGESAMRSAAEVAQMLGVAVPAGPPPPEPGESPPPPLPPPPMAAAVARDPASEERAIRAAAAMNIDVAALMASSAPTQRRSVWLLPTVLGLVMVVALMLGLSMLRKLKAPGAASAAPVATQAPSTPVDGDAAYIPPATAEPPPALVSNGAPASAPDPLFDAELARAQALQNARDWAGLLRYAQDWVGSRPQRTEPLFFLGAAHAGLGQHAQAVESLQTVVARDPANQQARLLLADNYLQSERWTDASALYKQMVADSPSDARLWNNYGAALNASGQPAQAVAALETAVRLDPSFKQAWTNLGNVYQSTGDSARASAAFANAR